MIRSDTPRLPARALAAGFGNAPADRTNFQAHLLGQHEVRRGLRGGAPALKGARDAYLSTQWRGEADRRPPVGLLRRVAV